MNIIENIYEKIEDFEHYITRPFRVYGQMLDRMFFWAWKMRWSWDFDAHTIYDMVYYKLDRIYKCMRDNGHCVWNANEETKDMRRLKELKGLAKNLRNGNYTRHTFNFFEKYKSSSSSDLFFSIRPNAKVIDSDLYRLMFKKAIDRDHKNRETDKARFFMMMEKYMERFWD